MINIRREAEVGATEFEINIKKKKEADRTKKKTTVFELLSWREMLAD